MSLFFLMWPSGRRVYVVQYRTREGQQRKRVLGQHGTMTVEQARTMARQWLGNVRRGSDPVDAYEATRQAPTVAELAARYMAEHATRRNLLDWERFLLRQNAHKLNTPVCLPRYAC